jgi:hypothetical protein
VSRSRLPSDVATQPFTARTAERYDVSRAALRSGRFRQLHRGAWIAAHVELTSELWLMAARLVLPVDAVLCGLSACDAWGLDVRPVDDVTVHVAFTDSVPRSRHGVLVRELLLLADEVVARGGWLVTTPLRTAFDCARWLPLVDAVVVVDALTHTGRFMLEELLEFARSHPGIRWVTRVARVVDLAEPLSESPMETRLRLLLVLAGLPRPRAQLIVLTDTGGFVARLDLAYEAARLAVEYDGALHWEQRRADDRRRDRLRALGWTVLVFSAQDYYGSPQAVVAQVGKALRRSAA